MDPLRFPCRVCGTSTDGVDTYVVCVDCLQDFDSGRRSGMRLQPNDELARAPLTPEAEARVRKLLSW
jgi:hypothetical protein